MMDVALLGDVPACATACIAAACSPLVEACFCPDKTPHAVPWDDHLTNCLSNNCTFAEQIVTCGVTWKECKVPVDELNLTPLIIIVLVVQLFFFSIRVWSMFIRETKLGLDDICITLAFIFLLCLVPVLSLIQHYGFYANVATGNARNLDKAAISFFALKALYAPALGCSKAALVFLYFRILAGGGGGAARRRRAGLWALQTANLLATLSFAVALPLACRPLRVYWAFSFDVAATATPACADVWDWGGYYTAANLALDACIVAVPVCAVARLPLDGRAKAGVVAMFCLGFVTMIMTVMRFVQMRRNANTFLADDIMNACVWTTLEPTTAFIVACIPSFRLVLRAQRPAARSPRPLAGPSKSRRRSGGKRRPRRRQARDPAAPDDRRDGDGDDGDDDDDDDDDENDDEDDGPPLSCGGGGGGAASGRAHASATAAEESELSV